MPKPDPCAVDADYVRSLETENARLLEALAHSSHLARHLQSVLDHVPSMIGYWDRELRNLFGNQAYYTWFGISPEQMHGMHIRDVIGEERYRLNLPYITGVLRGEAQIFERTIPVPDGQRVPHSLANYIPDIQDGEVRGFFVVVSDISVIKEAETALRLSEERYRNVVQDQTEVISRFRVDGTFTFANEAYCHFFWKTADELIGHKWHPVVFADDMDRVTEKLALLSSANPVVMIENRVYGGDSCIYWMEFTNRGIFDAAGQLVEIQSIGRDISKRKHAEEMRDQLTRQLELLSARLVTAHEEERSEIAYQLHEELGQELAAIKVYFNLAGYAGAAEDKGSPNAQALFALAHSMERIRQLVRNLAPRELELFGLYAAVEAYCGQFARTGGCSLHIDAPKPAFRAPRPVEMACFRVLQEGLSSALQHANASNVWVNVRQDAMKLELDIRDDGIGFDPDKISGNNRHDRENLGLFAMQVRAKHVGGSVTITSAPGEGAEVRAVFPLNANSPCGSPTNENGLDHF
jgi:PAS domain S-box-containing protein